MPRSAGRRSPGSGPGFPLLAGRGAPGNPDGIVYIYIYIYIYIYVYIHTSMYPSKSFKRF